MKYLVCIDNSVCKSYLTLGKVYVRIGEYAKVFWSIRDDNGKIREFSSSRFRSVKKNKINKLLFDFSVV